MHCLIIELFHCFVFIYSVLSLIFVLHHHITHAPYILLCLLYPNTSTDESRMTPEKSRLMSHFYLMYSLYVCMYVCMYVFTVCMYVCMYVCM